MKTNVPKREVNAATYEGGPAVKESAEKELVRATACCMLFEDSFYEKGNDLADRISKLCEKVSIKFICELAVKAREDYRLRHAPLFLCVQLLKKKGATEDRRLIGATIERVIQRADELAEIISLYWKDGKKPLPRQLKVGVATAFRKFNSYSLAKYNRDGAVKLRDALFLCHAKPKDAEQEKTWGKLIDGTLESPDTWEVELSAGKDKKETFERLIREKKLGYMALLRNLRNMEESGVDRKLVRDALMVGSEKSKALPFRYVAAARYAPSYAQDVSDAMLVALKDHPKLEGRTAILVDMSSSMDSELSGKSKMKRTDAACALAVLLREVADARVFAYSDWFKEVSAYRGMGLADAILGAGHHGGTLTGQAVQSTVRTFPNLDRFFIITDEQSADALPSRSDGKFRGYYINCATYEPALPSKGGQWTRISGFSERIVDWVLQEEKS